jgi:hypothetical protein
MLEYRFSALKIHYGLKPKDIFGVQIICPDSKNSIERLVTSLTENSNIKPVNKPLFKNLYQYKVVFRIHKKYDPTNGLPYKVQLYESFLNTFGRLYNLFDNEAESEYHKFSTSVVNSYKTQSHSKISPSTFTVYVNDDITLSMITTAYKSINRLDHRSDESDLYITKIEKFIKDTT